MADIDSAETARNCLHSAANCAWEPTLSGHEHEHALAQLLIEQGKAHALLAIATSIDKLAAAIASDHPLTDAIRDASHFLGEAIERTRP